MDWFDGDIAEAVRLSKEKNVIFVVFINGKTDDESMDFNELLNHSEIAGKLSDPTRYLAVRIESDTDTETYKQFAQIYRLVPVPSVFFIGKFGQPIDIVAEVNIEDFRKRMAAAEKTFYGSSSPVATEAVAQSPSMKSPPEKKPMETLKKQDVKTPQPKLSKEDLEMQQLKEERKRDKAADDEARRRVLEQIKMDRMRAQERKDHQTVSNANKPSVAERAEPSVVRNMPDMTRIQFRKPSGEFIVDMFKSDALFGDVWKYAKASVGVKDFVLATNMPPKKELSAEHSNQTLIELNLAPSAVLLVIPLATPSIIGGAVSARGGPVAALSSFVVTIFWALVGPILTLWNRFRNGSDEPATRNETANDGESTEGPSNIGSEIARKRNLARFNLVVPPGSSETGADSKSSKKSTSNVHRLKDYDSDEDNNTYNGNSTQQM